MDGLLNHENREQFLSWCEELGISLTDTALEQMNRYFTCLEETNQVMNLIRYPDRETFLTRHLLDALSVVPLIPDGARVVDLGSGGGIPIIPLAIARPDVTCLAIDSVGKKCRFIQSVSDTLELGSRLKALHGRMEDIGQNPIYREQFTTATARGLARMPVLLELAIPLIDVGGFVIAMKGTQAQQEVDDSHGALEKLYGRLEGVIPVEHPQLGDACMVLVEKERPTPPQYPRQAGTPQKHPLGHGPPPKSVKDKVNKAKASSRRR